MQICKILQMQHVSRSIAYVEGVGGNATVADGKVKGVAKSAENEYLNGNCKLCSKMFKILG